MIKRKRTSPIWKVDRETFIDFVNKSGSITQLLSYFNLKNKGSNARTLNKRLIEENIDYSHIKKYSFIRSKGIRLGGASPIPLDIILVENSTYNRNRLRKRLIKEGLLINLCYICGQGPEWNNKPLTLQLDHINGIPDDNRINNLRIICPHCHSQTETFAGRSNKNKKFKIS